MPIASNITALVGQTPMVRLNRIPSTMSCQAELIAKLESFNPTASVKDRIAGAMIQAAEREGTIAPQRTVLIEPIFPFYTFSYVVVESIYISSF